MLSVLWPFRKYIIGAFAILSLLGALSYYGHAQYSKGYNTCMHASETAKKEADKKALEGANETRKKIQALDDPELNNYLCNDIGIVRENNGCK